MIGHHVVCCNQGRTQRTSKSSPESESKICFRLALVLVGCSDLTGEVPVRAFAAAVLRGVALFVGAGCLAAFDCPAVFDCSATFDFDSKASGFSACAATGIGQDDREQTIISSAGCANNSNDNPTTYS